MESVVHQMALSGLVKPAQKEVWIAVLLTVFSGPAGMYYSTKVGCVVMCFASGLFYMFLGQFAPLLLWPICVVWAALAVRSANSIY